MQTISKCAIFNYSDKDSKIVKEVAEYLDSNAGKIFKFFNLTDIEEMPTINIVSSKSEFDMLFKNAWGYEPEKDSRGFAKNNIITYLSIFEYDKTTHAYKTEDFDSVLVDYKKTLLHEFVHFVNGLFRKYNNCGYTEKYLSEGLAICLSGQKDNLKLLFNVSLEELVSGKSSYNGYYLVVKYLLDNYDKAFVLELVKSNRKAREFLSAELYDKTKDYYNSLSLVKD